MIGEYLDRAIGIFAPAIAAQRMSARATMAQIQNLAGGGTGGYKAGRLNRLTKPMPGAASENSIPSDEIARLRYQSWELYRNNPWAKKIVRSIVSKVIGKGLEPSSQANNEDGTAFTEFRQRARELWCAMERCADFRGVPGRGGLCLSQMQRLILQSVILSGESLLQFKPIGKVEQRKRGAPIPLSMLIIDAARLYDYGISNVGNDSENTIFRGVELDASMRRVAYHLHKQPLGMLPQNDEVARVSVDEMIHLLVEDDVDQIRGVPWFASAIMQMRDTGDYQYNELKASAMAACVVLGYRKPTGATQSFGVRQDSSEDTVDDNGNAITSLQPGLVVNLGKDGHIEGFNPARPGANSEAFIQHMLRGTAVAMPGVKSSTVTGDYRNASFSSEKAADNDCWPEVEQLQEWFVEHLLQPVFERLVTDAITLTDWFDGILTIEEFADRKTELLQCHWQGPTAKSINPEKDVQAATSRIQGGLSSLQIECAAIGVDWRQIIRDAAEVLHEIETQDLPEEFGNQLLGIDKSDVTEDTGSEAAAEAVDATAQTGDAEDNVDQEEAGNVPTQQAA